MDNNNRNEHKGLRVGFVSINAWSVYNFRLDVVRWLLQQGYEVLVMAATDEYAALLEKEGCVFVPVNFSNRSENPFSDYLFYLHLKKLYTVHKPDMLFHFVVKPNIYGSLAASAKKIPSVAVVTGLGYAFAKHNWLYRVVKLLYRKALKTTAETWFLNNDDAKVFITEKIVAIEKVKVLPGEGVNTNHFSKNFNGEKKNNKRFKFLMSTRLLKSKGIGIYADAARILKNKNYDLDIELIGIPEEHHPDAIPKEDLNRWEKEGLLFYSGFARDVRPFLLNADCFVFPSFYNEGIPRGLMEAASMELPVITSRNRGCKEVVVNNSTGYLCNMNDPFDLADKMEKIMNLPQTERDNMGKNGRLLVSEKFNIEKVIEEYAQTVKKLSLMLR
jgi:glycosyltransferase involved in cell wall biosynthesis